MGKECQPSLKRGLFRYALKLGEKMSPQQTTNGSLSAYFLIKPPNLRWRSEFFVLDVCLNARKVRKDENVSVPGCSSNWLCTALIQVIGIIELDKSSNFRHYVQQAGAHKIEESHAAQQKKNREGSPVPKFPK